MSGNINILSTKINNVRNMLYNKSNSKRINVFVPNGSTTNTCFSYTGTTSVVGGSITWTIDTENNCSYNTARNIYVYWV